MRTILTLFCPFFFQTQIDHVLGVVKSKTQVIVAL